MTVGFIGVGRISTAIAKGLLRAKYLQPEEAIAAAPSDESRRRFSLETGIATTESNVEVVRGSDIVLLCVEGAAAERVLSEIAEAMSADKMLVSVVGSLKLVTMERHLVRGAKFVRAMPNIAVECARGVTALCYSENSGGRSACPRSAEFREKVRKLFQSLGLVYEIQESQLGAVVGVSASGIAVVLEMMRIFASVGEEFDLSPEESLALACQTFGGAAALVEESSEPPETLRDLVITPGGVTEKAFRVADTMELQPRLKAVLHAAANEM